MACYILLLATGHAQYAPNTLVKPRLRLTVDQNHHNGPVLCATSFGAPLVTGPNHNPSQATAGEHHPY